MQNLTFTFRMWMRAGKGRGEVSTQQPVKINDRRGYQPDFAWYRQEFCAPPSEPRSFSGPPSLIVEVLSPSARAFDLMRKRKDYDDIGIDEVWFVDGIKRQVLVCSRPEPGQSFKDIELDGGSTLASPLLPGFDAPVSSLFEF